MRALMPVSVSLLHLGHVSVSKCSVAAAGSHKEDGWAKMSIAMEMENEIAVYQHDTILHNCRRKKLELCHMNNVQKPFLNKRRDVGSRRMYSEQDHLYII